MIDINNIREHTEVVGSDGRHVGTVDHVQNGQLKLTKSDSGSFGDSGHHHYIQRSQIDRIEDGRVVLNVAANDLRQSRSAEPEMAGAEGSSDRAAGREGGSDGGRGTSVADQNRDSAGSGNFAGGTPGGINTGAQNTSGTMGADGTAGIGGGALGTGSSGGLGTGRDRGF